MKTEWTWEDSQAAIEEGWEIFVMDEGPDAYQLQAVSERALFLGDEVAWSHVRRWANAGVGLHKRALAFLAEHSPAEYQRIMAWEDKA